MTASRRVGAALLCSLLTLALLAGCAVSSRFDRPNRFVQQLKISSIGEEIFHWNYGGEPFSLVQPTVVSVHSCEDACSAKARDLARRLLTARFEQDDSTSWKRVDVGEQSISITVRKVARGDLIADPIHEKTVKSPRAAIYVSISVTEA